MINDYELCKLAHQRQAELLQAARTEQVLKEAGWLKPMPLTAKLLLAAGLGLPFAMLLARLVSAAGSASLI